MQTSKPPLELDKSSQHIMLVDRGPTNSYTSACKFTEKVWNAQNAGAVAVLVVNYDDSQTTMVGSRKPDPFKLISFSPENPSREPFMSPFVDLTKN